MHFAKKSTMLFVLILSILAAGVSTPAQVGKAKFDVPTRLKLNGAGEPDPKEESHMALITESFYPLGWSRDGKFAYYLEPPDEECGCYFAELVIRDADGKRTVAGRVIQTGISRIPNLKRPKNTGVRCENNLRRSLTITASSRRKILTCFFHP